MKECTSEWHIKEYRVKQYNGEKKHILKGKILYQLQEAQENQLGKLNNEYT